MINDHTHKNSLSNIALQLFSITPHSVMPERLFSILDWQHTKRRNRLSPFTLEAIAKIHTFYKNGSVNADDGIDVGQIEEILNLTDDLTISSNISEDKNNLSNDANVIMEWINENHEILRAKSEAESIDVNDSTDDELIPELPCLLNVQDRDFKQILIDVGFIDVTQITEGDESDEEKDTGEKASNEDYDVDELLSASMAL